MNSISQPLSLSHLHTRREETRTLPSNQETRQSRARREISSTISPQSPLFKNPPNHQRNATHASHLSAPDPIRRPRDNNAPTPVLPVRALLLPQPPAQHLASLSQELDFKLSSLTSSHAALERENALLKERLRRRAQGTLAPTEVPVPSAIGNAGVGESGAEGLATMESVLFASASPESNVSTPEAEDASTAQPPEPYPTYTPWPFTSTASEATVPERKNWTRYIIPVLLAILSLILLLWDIYLRIIHPGAMCARVRMRVRWGQKR
ncbi:hypothetical protein BU23DRAFT_93909 [Bimuria novae-zelandiae CBS 107.79]|uniref:Uncharacterized protein n=1 Tax=Bimuria novae-zelandiae CBS 107.79 TaxID=1447943 RepID=A0A6A5VES1_9PLEO|nr:hypothetical protein BU23DRAFT_93909 [Bimuria novae-zelandiae CBS 107.79]